MSGRILHVVPGLADGGNGIAVAAKLIAASQGAELLEAADASALAVRLRAGGPDEVWVHSMWTPAVLRACGRVVRSGVPLVRMPHGCLDPVRLAYHGGRKRLVAPLERLAYGRTARVVVTCAAEADWVRAWGWRGAVEELDLKRFFDLDVPAAPPHGEVLRVLFLGRRHPLKGLAFLEQAVEAVNREPGRPVELRVGTDVFGEEKERLWDWCEVLCLPTLSENFGLVVAEALARGKRVLVTDGAPAWSGSDEGGRLAYLRGYRAGDAARRVALLAEALGRLRRVNT